MATTSNSAPLSGVSEASRGVSDEGLGNRVSMSCCLPVTKLLPTTPLGGQVVFARF